MTFYQQIKTELSAKRENTKYFNKQFLTDYIEAKRAFITNRKNGGAYCVFLEIMTDHKEAYI